MNMELHPNWAGWVILASHGLVLVCVAFLHGVPRTERWDFRKTLAQSVVALIVLYIAGAFSGATP